DEKIQFEVWDNGIGIEKKSFEKLFRPFEQIDSKLSRNYEGTGLGLALVNKLVALHNGSISVESEVGKGSRFIVQLPYSNNNIQPEHTSSSTKSIEENDLNKSATMKKKKILLAEDNDFNITTITEYLTAKGLKVELAFNGIETLEKVLTIKPDLVIMDIQMPQVDGLEATQRIRKIKDPSISKIPIIAVTALAMPGDRERCIQAGANEYLRKPVSLKEIHNLILEYLK
ncbi:MAG: response regulator, partial [Okeania sp. SIO3C4]|nr:response regulator [Okeania sp. SIO3C4]